MTAIFEIPTTRVRGVEAAAALLKRCYLASRETMRAMAAWHINVANWEAKCLLPRHIWHLSLGADLLRTRVLELRYPRRDVDVDHDPQLVGFLSQLAQAQTDAELLSGIYEVLLPALRAALETYARLSDPVDDAPTHYWLPRLLDDLQTDIQEGVALLAALPLDQWEEAAPWAAYLTDSLAAIGGVLGDGPRSASPVAPAFTERLAYTVPLIARRDPRFTPAIVHMPKDPPQTAREEQVWIGINHANEMWAAEAPLAMMWQFPTMPWQFYLDVARWAYDESRHATMGLRRMQAWGFEPGIDFPLVADHYNSISDQGPLQVLVLLHAFEQSGPAWKQDLKARYEEMGDAFSAQDCDYDWADEAIHLKYGHTWLRHLLGEERMADLPAMVKRAREQWEEWRLAQWAAHPDTYAAFMPRLQAKMAAAQPEVQP